MASLDNNLFFFPIENLKNSSVNPQENVEEVLIEDAVAGEFEENDINVEN